VGAVEGWKITSRPFTMVRLGDRDQLMNVARASGIDTADLLLR
jgi:hypothetical protein